MKKHMWHAGADEAGQGAPRGGLSGSVNADTKERTDGSAHNTDDALDDDELSAVLGGIDLNMARRFAAREDAAYKERGGF